MERGRKTTKHKEFGAIVFFGRAVVAWALIAAVVVVVALFTARQQRLYTESLERERDGTIALALAFTSCETVNASLLDANADRFGLSSDDEASVTLLLDAVIARWPLGCARLTAANTHLRKAHGNGRAAFAERVAAISDVSAAQAALVAGAEDALHGAHSMPVRDPAATEITARVARSVADYVRAANHPQSRPELERRYRATIRATNDAARWAFGSMEDTFNRRIAQARSAERRTVFGAGVLLALAALALAVICYAFERRRRAKVGEARERIERLSAELARQQAVRALAVSETQFRALFDGSTTGVALLDRAGAAFKANVALQKMVPELDPAVLGVTHPAYVALWDGAYESVAFESECGSGSDHRWFDVNLSVIRGDEGAPWFVMSLVREITERKVADRLLIHQATHDSLTGLPNRSLFFDRLREHVARGPGAGASAVFFIDLDDFKLVNDSMGHESGDVVLVAAAQRLRSELAGQLVARLGGDEFGVLVEGCAQREDVERVARLLVAAFLPPLSIEGREVFVTVTVGVAFRESGSLQTASMLVRDADIAMYHAKRSGRSRYAVFNNEMRKGIVRRSVLVSEMRKALDHGDFVVAFQPIIRLDDRSIYGYEALARWHHPQLGIIAPDEFIPVAEQTGMIHTLGEAVLRRTCECVSAWKEQTPDLPLQFSVNVSVQQLLTVGFEERSASLVRSFGLDPANFTLEVTESALLAAGPSSTQALKRLKRAGFQLSIDDFGTGYSSLSYLQRFPFDEVKIDMCFVVGPGEGLANEPIITMVVALGESLNVRVVAEGVETEAQAERLQALGCLGAQGFFFSAVVAPPFQAPATTTG